MTSTLLTEYLGNTPQLKIIDFFLDNGNDYSKKEILENAGISKTTLYKVWSKLEDFEIVVPKRKYGNTTLFELNKKNILVKQIMSMDSALSMQAMTKAEKIAKQKQTKPLIFSENS